MEIRNENEGISRKDTTTFLKAISQVERTQLYTMLGTQINAWTTIPSRLEGFICSRS